MISFISLLFQIPLAIIGLFAYFGRQFFVEFDDQCRLVFRKLERWGK